MGFLNYLSAICWATMGSSIGYETVEGLLCFLIAAVFCVGGSLIFAAEAALKASTIKHGEK